MSNLPSSSLDLALASIRKHARLALHFHPDHPVGSRNVARALLEDGIYKSQWVSNGSVSVHPGGMRDEGERSLCDGASCVEPAHRPKYGALDLMQNSDGPAPRFGSCFFILKPEVSSRSTFTFGGSHLNPKYRGTFHEFHAVLAVMFQECFMRNFALGVSDIRPAQLMERILNLESPLQDPSDGHPSRNLEHFVEAQVHGEVRLGRDVEALVVDPLFRDSDTGRDLEAMAAKYKFPSRWHYGFRMRVADVPLDFRGPTMPSLAARVARDGMVDAEVIGRGVKEVSKHPENWRDRGMYAEVL